MGRQMQAVEILTIVLVVAAIVVCGVLIYALLELVKTARSTRLLADDTRERLVPLLDKVDVTVDAANAELLRIDGILTQFEEVSDRVSSTTHAVQGAVNAPLDAVNAVGTGVRDVITEWRRNRKNPQSTP